MKNLRPLIAAMCMNLPLIGAVMLPQTVVAADKQEEVGAKVGKPLQEALTAGQAKKWDEAVAKLQAAEAVPDKTAFEQYKINQIYSWVYVSQKKFAEAAAYYEKLISSGFLSDSEMETDIKTVTQLYLSTKNNAKAMEYLQRWLRAHPDDKDMTYVLAQLQYQSGQQKQALSTLDGLVKDAEKSGQPPKEDWLKLMYGISAKLNTNPTALDKQTLSVVGKLVRYYPNQSYWQAMLLGLKTQVTADASKFQLDRLMMAVGVLKDPDEYVEFAQLANNFGFPGEAVSVLDTGFQKGVLGTGPGKDREQRLKASMAKAAAADKPSLPPADKAGATGQEDASVGEAYLGYGQNAEAITALERGIKRGGLKKPEQALLALGMAYLRSNQTDKARAAFKQVTGDSDLADIASLWVLHASAK
jgi:tetratricopeptide (TPR) repeat protein